jgi:hypothetical protein
MTPDILLQHAAAVLADRRATYGDPAQIDGHGCGALVGHPWPSRHACRGRALPDRPETVCLFLEVIADHAYEKSRFAILRLSHRGTPAGAGGLPGQIQCLLAAAERRVQDPRSGPSRRSLKPKPQRCSKWRHGQRNALSHHRAPVQGRTGRANAGPGTCYGRARLLQRGRPL